MPWKERSVMEERMKLGLRLLECEEVSGLCREVGISGKARRLPSLTRHAGLSAIETSFLLRQRLIVSGHSMGWERMHLKPISD